MPRYRLVLSVVFLAVSAVIACRGGAAAPPGASMVTLALVNGRIWTGDPAQPEAEAVAIAGNRIAHVGRTADVRGRAGGTFAVSYTHLTLPTKRIV